MLIESTKTNEVRRRNDIALSSFFFLLEKENQLERFTTHFSSLDDKQISLGKDIHLFTEQDRFAYLEMKECGDLSLPDCRTIDEKKKLISELNRIRRRTTFLPFVIVDSQSRGFTSDTCPNRSKTRWISGKKLMFFDAAERCAFLHLCRRRSSHRMTK